MVAAETKLFMHASSEISKMFLQVVADGIGILGSALRKFSLQMVADENGNFRSVLRKNQKNNSAQVGQNFENQLPDNLSGIKNSLPTKLVGSTKSNSCPGWAEVKNHFAAICTEVDKTTSTHVVSKLDLRKNKAPTFHG